MIWSIVARETRTKAQLERLQARLASKASRDEKSVELGELTLPPLAALCGRNGLEEGRERTSVAARLCIALRKGLRTKLWRRQSPQAWKCGRRREWRYVGEQCRRLRRYVTSTASVAVKSAVSRGCMMRLDLWRQRSLLAKQSSPSCVRAQCRRSRRCVKHDFRAVPHDVCPVDEVQLARHNHLCSAGRYSDVRRVTDDCHGRLQAWCI